MTITLFTSRGEPQRIGRELGSGGEGAVHDVIGQGDQVAKLYHQPPDASKQAKLGFMADSASAELLRYVAWPQETLHRSRGGPLVGFLMPKVAGKEPVHMMYSPVYRRQHHPNAAWDYLLFAARNIAAAFEVVHARGHIVGDVNQSSIMVGRDSTVVLIDSDSFQINASGRLHRCTVGVSHFTPPELQGASSFDGVIRTANHDAFGLALLIFHVLLGGRHPYSGVPRMSGVGETLEGDIRSFRYAHARDARNRGIAPPPHAIPLAALSPELEAMLHVAFTERGAAERRATARQWVEALDAQREHLVRCGKSPVHVHADHLAECPWCGLERHGVVYFIDPSTALDPSAGFGLVQVWAAIESVPPPEPLVAPPAVLTAAKPRPLPRTIPGRVLAAIVRVIGLTVGATLTYFAPALWGIGLTAAVFGWVIINDIAARKRRIERVKRESLLASARKEHDEELARARLEVGPEGFLERRAALARLRDEYRALPRTQIRELDVLHSGVRERKLREFLQQWRIESAGVTDLGPSQLASLRASGVRNAADVTYSTIGRVSGLGPALMRALLDWRSSCERKFVFDASSALTVADRDAVRAKLAARRIALESRLRAGVEELRGYKVEASRRRQELLPRLERSARNVARAQLDLTVV